MIAQKWNNRIFTNITNAVFDVCQHTTIGSSSTITEFPTLSFKQIGGNNASTDLEINDCGANVTYQIEVFTHGSGKILLNEEIISLADEAFHKMGFQCIHCEQIDNLADETIYRTVARYRRYIGGGEEIKLI